MRKLLILATLCLFFVATPLNHQKAEAVTPQCAMARIKAVTARVAAEAVCAGDDVVECYKARAAAGDLEWAASLTCALDR